MNSDALDQVETERAAAFVQQAVAAERARIAAWLRSDPVTLTIASHEGDVLFGAKLDGSPVTNLGDLLADLIERGAT